MSGYLCIIKNHELLRICQAAWIIPPHMVSNTNITGFATVWKAIRKMIGEELESENLKKQKLDENVEAEADDEAKMKRHMEIAIDAIPLAIKPPIIVDWKIIKEGKMGYFQIIRADGSSKRYSSMIQMLQNIDREDLETLWKLVKAKHGLTRPEEAYERDAAMRSNAQNGTNVNFLASIWQPLPYGVVKANCDVAWLPSSKEASLGFV
ncbi:hypothetical protein Tco_1025742, partial [Tanacetum coccineum]